MKKKLKKSAVLGILLSTTIAGGVDVHAQEMNAAEPAEETAAAASYTTKDIDVVEMLKDPFGNVITEQSYYRTGGDVNVIDRETLEKRHFNQLSDALKTVPGVLVRKPGYRGGEMGIEDTHSVLSINGDERVVVLVDGRRVDNSAANVLSAYSEDGTKAMLDINQIINMNGVEQIEVIKGPGASVYGSDATGGVINIITRKGEGEAQGTLDVSAGSWNRYNYKFSYSGSLDANRLKYFVSLSREMSGDGKYKDGLTGNNYRWLHSGYKDQAANIRVDYNFDKDHTLYFAHNHVQGDDDYPHTAPDYRYINPTDWHRILTDWYNHRKRGEKENPGFRNLRYGWGPTGAYNAYNRNNNDLTYVFHRDNGMESFVRVYNQNERYWGTSGAGDVDDPNIVPNTPAWDEWVRQNYVGRNEKYWFFRMENYGMQLQLGKAYNRHNLLTTWTYDRSKFENHRLRRRTVSRMERSSINGYLQDKIFVSDKFEITPSLRYARYTDTTESDGRGGNETHGQTRGVFTPALHMQYAFKKGTSAYLGYTRVHRPLRPNDYTTVYEDPYGNELRANLKDERGDVWTIGLRHDFSKKTSASVHYDYTWMSNAVVGYNVLDPNDPRNSFYRPVNARELKKSFNLTLQHRFDKHLTISADYFHTYDRYSAKDGMTFDPDLSLEDGNVNTAINELRPTNIYKFDISYDNRKLNASLSGTWYTGMNTMVFSSNRKMIMDFNINYKLHKDMTIYASIENLTNTAYETVGSDYYGIAAFPELGRGFMIGAKYTF